MKRRLWLGIAAGAALAIVIVVLLGAPRSASAASCAWTGTNSTDWTDAGNWSGCGGGTPGALDAVSIDVAANQPLVPNGTTVMISSLIINGGASVQVGGVLSVTSGSGIGRLDMQSGGTLDVQPGGVAGVGGDTTISGTLMVESGGLARFATDYTNASITATGILTGGGDVLVTGFHTGVLAVYGGYNLGGQLTLANNGTASFYTPTIIPRLSILAPTGGGLSGATNVTVTQAMTWTGGNLSLFLKLAIAPGATLSVDSPTYVQLYSSQSRLNNYGTINWLRGNLNAGGSFANQSGGVFNSFGDIVFQPTLYNYGTLNVLSGTLQTTVFQNAGTTKLGGGNVKGNVLLVNGLLTGSGTITGSVQNNYDTVNATLAPGSPLGALNITGNYFQYPGGTLSLELGGTTAGSTYDVLNVGGTFGIQGSLVISQVNGFMANAGDSFRAMNFGTLVGPYGFASITNALASTHFVQLNPDHMLLTEPAAFTQLRKRPNVTVSELGTLNGYTLSIFNPTSVTVTVAAITDSLPLGLAYLSGSTTGATTVEPAIDFDLGYQRLVWTGTLAVSPTSSIALNFGVLVAPATTGTYSNSAAIRVNSSVTDTRVISVNNVAPVVVPLTTVNNVSVAAPGGKVQNSNPPLVLIHRADLGTVPITITALIVCPFDSCGTIQNVFIVHGPISYTMQFISGTLTTARRPNGDKGSNYGFWKGTIPGTGVIPGVPMRIFPDWSDHHPCIGPGPSGCVSGDPGPGTPYLYDPSGHVTDAQTTLPIANATVTLYRAPALQPDTRTETRGCRTLNTRPGGLSGNWDSLPPAVIGLGVLEDALLAPASIDPPVNPQLADAEGHFGWNVVTGCWFVVAGAPGYASKVSALVGVPPEVTDLNIALQPLPNRLYLPLIER